jgi:hypothetical protein
MKVIGAFLLSLSLFLFQNIKSTLLCSVRDMSEAKTQYPFNIKLFIETILYLEKFNNNLLQNTLCYSEFFDMFRPELLNIFRRLL